MSDRGFLFLFSLVMIVGGLAFAGWLFATGQAGTVDGLFLLLTALLVVVVFALYVMFMINRARQAAKAGTEPAKAGSPAKTKSSPAAVSEL